MYVWKVWFRVADPPPGLPWLRTLQCHRFQSRWRVSPGTGAAWHVFIVLDGAFAAGPRERRRVLGPGDVLAYPVAHPPDLGLVRDGAAGTFLVAELHGDGMAAVLPALAAADGAMQVDLGAPGIQRLLAWRRAYERMVATNARRRGDTPTPELGWPEAMRLAAGLIGVLAEGRRGGGSSLARRATEQARISARFDLAVGDLARFSGCSRQRLAVAFRAAGLPAPGTWLRRRRMAEAARLLDEGLPVATVADRLGYASDATLARAYRRLEGRAPRRGRR